MPAPSDVRVECECEPIPLPITHIREVVGGVLAGETSSPVQLNVTFVSPERMRDLNERHIGHTGATDVIAFGLPHPGLLVGDVYVCPDVARITARESGVSEEEELLRLVVHGTLHVLGYEHPAGEERYRSRMWRVQEAYVRSLGDATP